MADERDRRLHEQQERHEHEHELHEQHERHEHEHELHEHEQHEHEEEVEVERNEAELDSRQSVSVECTIKYDALEPKTISAQRMLTIVHVPPPAQVAEDLIAEPSDRTDSARAPEHEARFSAPAPAAVEEPEETFVATPTAGDEEDFAESSTGMRASKRTAAPAHADDEDSRLTRVDNRSHPLSFNAAPRPASNDAFSYAGQPRKASLVATAQGKHVIEGHQSLVGWLFKKGGWNKNWKRRWFSYVQGSGHVQYFRDQLSADRKGSALGRIEVYKVKSVRQTLDSADAPTQHGFVVNAEGRDWCFCALNPEEQTLWMKLFDTFTVGAGRLVM
jgi:hypothetical protein